MLQSIPFEFEVPISFFEKADAGAGKQRRIGGIISTDSKDRQGEVVLQNGLNFSPFLEYGWFNDNHSKITTDILGYPEAVKFFRKGAQLPDGTIAKTNGHWAEGYLLNTKKASDIWDTGIALQQTNRRLGYSIEGSVQKRTGSDAKTVAQATVRNVAITNCPVNGDSRLEVLAKSLLAVERSEEAILKALGMGGATPGVSIATQGPMTGMGAGRVLAGQSLEHGKPRKKLRRDGVEDDEETEKALSVAEAIAFVRTRLPQASEQQAQSIVRATLAMKRNGVL